MSRTVFCNVCQTAHKEVSEDVAIYKITSNNRFVYQSAEEIIEAYNLEPIYIEDFQYCVSCGNEYLFFTQYDDFLDDIDEFTLPPILASGSKLGLSTDYYLDKSHEQIISYCLRFGRLAGEYKTLQDLPYFEPKFEEFNLHNIFYPFQPYNQFIDVLAKVDRRYIQTLLKPLQRYFHAYQRFIYIRAYKHAIRLFPHIAYELVICSSYPELLEHLVS